MARQKPAPETGMVERIRTFQRSAKSNKRCADCTELGPTYVCTDYQTFVCQICSGIHREFGHKIKGISLSDWTQKEAEGIEQGGNERAAQKWLARWKPEHQAEPDNAQPDRIRDFIRQKYVEKRWLGRGDNDARLQSRRSCPAVVTGILEDAASQQLPYGKFSIDASTAIPAAASNWTADFSTPAVAPATSSPAIAVAPASGDSQWVADFSSIGAAPVAAAPQQQVPAPAPAVSHGINPCLLGLDFTGEAKKAEEAAIAEAAKKAEEIAAADAARAEKLAPVLEAAARAAAERAAATPGEQLRDALLNGSGDAVRRLYEDAWNNPGATANVPQRVSMPPPPVTHFYIGDEGPATVSMAYHDEGVKLMSVTSPSSSPEVKKEAANMNMFDDDDVNEISPSREFDDLIHAFQEKNPVLGFDL